LILRPLCRQVLKPERDRDPRRRFYEDEIRSVEGPDLQDETYGRGFLN
jgi:hypothetical protein